MLRLFVSLCITVAVVRCQTDQFSCNGEWEILNRTTETGSVQSPCYNDSNVRYPEELSGRKMINISYMHYALVGFQLTVKEFDLDMSDRLFIGDGTTVVNDIRRGVRKRTMRSGSAENLVAVRQDDDGAILATLDITGSNKYIIPNYDPVIMDFYTSTGNKSGKAGFFIEYAADIDKCQLVGSDVYCKNNGECSKTGFNVATCNCTGTGYQGDTCEDDIDECDANTTPCTVTGNCTNLNGSFNCICNPGYEGGIGAACTDIDECIGTENCHSNATCADTIGSYTCTCKDGYTGDGINCTDVNECTKNTDACHATLAECINNDGSYDCACNNGYTGDGRTCEDIDECVPGGNDCDSSADCKNVPGGWTCTCKTGYTGNGTHCTDINECDGTNDCHADATCSNNNGSYECTCKGGYTGIGRTLCSNLNECILKTDNCHRDAECNDTLGSFYCKCKSGFSGDGRDCSDIEECVQGQDNCHANAYCNNTEGSYICQCKEGYTGDGEICENIDECSADPIPCGVNADCTDNNGSYACACKKGFTGDATVSCNDIDECVSGTNPCNLAETSCVNTVGSYKCLCSFPEFRGTAGDCKYYCKSNSTCLVNREGSIDHPTNGSGVLQYEPFKETYFKFIDVSNATVKGGIRFTFKSFSTEEKDDFLSIYPGSEPNSAIEIVALSGSRENLYNIKELIRKDGEIANVNSGVTAVFNRPGSDPPTLTLSTSFINILFTSDRQNTSTGFEIDFEYDKDDCPVVSTCKNVAGPCIDGVFAYQCNCLDGYEGIDCDMDINECILSTPICNGNATCSNTNGSYGCECNDYFDGDGKSCQPHLILSNYSVKKTPSSLSIKFDVTEMWRTTDFIRFFTIVVEGPNERKVYENVTLSTVTTGDGLIVNNLAAYTPYNVTVMVQETGGQYGNTTFENKLGSQIFYTEEQAAGVPQNLAVSNSERGRANITWEAPPEIGFGVVTSYDVCYRPASDAKSQEVAQLRSITLEATCFTIDNTYTSYVWVDLPRYLSLEFMIRANSSAGAGNYTSTQMAYTGSSCTAWENFADRSPCPPLNGLLESEEFPLDSTNAAATVITHQWSFDLTSYNGWRPNFEYFDIPDKESIVDWGYGDIDITILDNVKDNRKQSYTGRIDAGPDPVIGFPKNVTLPEQNTLWFSFISDRTRKGRGFQLEIEVDGDNCMSTPCLNGGNCTDKLYGYDCSCTSEWTHHSCQTPRVEPVVSCTPDKRMAEISFTIPAGREIDETIIGGYTAEITGGPGASTAEMTFVENTTLFTGLLPYTDYTITVTVKPSVRDVVLVQGTTTCKTKEDVPTAPQNVVVDRGDKSLIVTWDAPAEPNGNVTYIVSATTTDHDNYGETLDTKNSVELITTTYTITNLRVYRNYRVVVRAKTVAGGENADAVTETTNPGPPLAIIAANVTVLTGKSARIEWVTAAGAYPGPTTISIYATSDGHNVTNDTSPDIKSPYILHLLEEGFNYTVTVTASTGVDPDSSFTVYNVNTNETAPGKPATFIYDDTSSTFSWTAPLLLEQNGDITGYVLKSSDTVPGFSSPRKFDASTFKYTLTNLPPFTRYVFTLQAENSFGEGMEYQLSILTKEAIPQNVKDVTEVDVQARQITLSWTAEDPPVGQVTYDVTYSDGTTTSPTTTADPNITLTGLTPNTNYTISITAKTNAGSATGVTRVVKTKEDTPSAVQNLVATFDNNNYAIDVVWDIPVTPNGQITGYKVMLSDGRSEDVTEIKHTFSGVVLSQKEFTITVTASTSAGAGPPASTNVTTPRIVPKAPEGLVVLSTTNDSVFYAAKEPSNTGPNLVTVTKYIVTLSQDQDDCTNKGDSAAECLQNIKYNNTGSPSHTITGLKAYRKYIMTLAAEGEGGVGPDTSPVNFTTDAGPPGTPTITVTQVPGGFDVVFTPSKPYTGPANYTAIATPKTGGDPISNTIKSDSPNPVTVQLRNVPGDKVYTVVGRAEGQGHFVDTPSQMVSSTPSAPSATAEASANGEITVTIASVSEVSEFNYTITYTKVDCTNCTMTNNDTGKVLVITGLEPYTNYSISVFATSFAGRGESLNLVTRTQPGTPKLKDPGFGLQFSNNTDGINTAYSIRVVNLCNDKQQIFDHSEGPITAIAYLVQQEGSTLSANGSINLFYNNVVNENPRRVYRSITVNCNNARRKKRQADNNDVVIGTEGSCPSGNSECNGQLSPDTNYRMVACGMNDANRYACTNPSDLRRTSSVPPSGLTGGEIAAIVICSILILLLIVLIIVYCCKKRNQSGKARISRKGAENPVFEEQAGQRYKVDPAAGPHTEYTGQPTA